MSREGTDARRRTGRWWLAGVAVLAALVVVAVASVIASTRHSSPAPVASAPGLGTGAAANPDVDFGGSAGGAPAPGFTLRDQRGRSVSLAQFRGKVVVLAFVDARCTTICPLTTAGMVDAMQMLGPLSGRVQLVGVDVNPLAHRVADVAAYTRAHHLVGRWRFLTGSRSQLDRVWQAYHVYTAVTHGKIDHQPVVLLIDGKGRERTLYMTQMRYGGVQQQAQILAQGIARLIPGQPSVSSRVSLGYVRPLRPSAHVTLPPLGRTPTAVLGAAHPHLLVFFASWLSEGVDLEARLAALDRYRTEAAAHGWPSPVALDELSTESAPAAVQPRLVRLAEKLRYPLVEDSVGRLADGYRVKDLPWLVLTSSSGRILWHHDGWLSASALARDVRSALGA